MALGLAYWIVMLIWLILSLVHVYGTPMGGPIYWYFGINILAFVLFLLLGWRVFGPPLHG